jgi:uncharacterized protein (TIGR02996 family)
MIEEASFVAALRANPDDDDTRRVYADWLEEHGHGEPAADLRLEIAAPTVRSALGALFARLDTATTREERMAAMLRAGAAARRAKMRGWTELVGQTSHVIARSDDPISALVGLACAADDPAVRDAANAWLADHGARQLGLRCIARLGRVPRNATCAVLETTVTQALMSLCLPDPGTHVWTSTFDGMLCSIELATGAVTKIADELGELLYRRLATANGRVFAALVNAAVVEEWRGTERVRTLEGHSQLITAIATDGVHVAVGGHATHVSIWNVDTGERTSIETTEATRSLALRGDTLWAGGTSGTIRVCSIANLEIRQTIDLHTGPVTAIAIAGDDVISASTEIYSLDHFYGDHGGFTIASLAVAGDRVISAGHDSVVRIWDRKTGRRLQTCEGHGEWIYEVIAHPDGARVLSCSADGTVRITDLEHALELPPDKVHWNRLFWIVPLDADRMVVGGVESAHVRGLGLDRVLWSQQESCAPLVVLGDLAVAASSLGGGTPHVRALADGMVVRPLEAEGGVCCVDGYPGDRRIVGGCEDGKVLVWNVDTGKVIATFEGHTGEVREIHRHPDHDRVITMSFDNTLRVWSLATGTCLHTLAGHTAWPRGFVIVGERVVSWSLDHTLRTWDLAHGSELGQLPMEIDHGAAVPGSSHVVLAGAELSLFDAATMSIVRTVQAHERGVIAVAVSPAFIATSSEDHSLAVWSHDLELVARWQGRYPGGLAWLSPRRLAVTESHGEILVLEL